jgi:hypothetical protein
MMKQQFRMQIVDVAEILLCPVCISHVSPSSNHASTDGTDAGSVNDEANHDAANADGEEQEDDEKVGSVSMRVYYFFSHF